MSHTLGHTLTKTERLYLRDEINSLFAEAKGFVSYPLRVLYVVKTKEREIAPPAAMMVSVAKRRFRRAVRRNRIKRLIREAYRLNKQILTDSLQDTPYAVHVAFLMVSSDLPDYSTVERAVVKALHRIAKQIPLCQ